MMTYMRAPLTGTPRTDGRWQITVTLTRADGAKIRKVLCARTQREVQAKARTLLAKTGHIAPNDATINDLLDYCEASVWNTLAPRTQEKNLYMGKHVRARFGERKVQSVTAGEIHKWIKALGDAGKLSGSTISGVRGVLRMALQQAVFLEWLETNPAAQWRTPVSAKVKEHPPISPAQIQEVIEAQTDPHKRAWYMTLWETGARALESTMLESRHLLKTEKGWWLMIPGTKTENAARMVPVSSELANVLLDLPEPWFPYGRKTAQVWRDTMAALGWIAKRTNKAKPALGASIPLRAWRKARITLWGDMGLSDEVWAKLAGHSSAELTREIYDRVSLDRIEKQIGR